MNTDLFSSVQVATEGYSTFSYGVSADDVTVAGYFNEVFDQVKVGDLIVTNSGTAVDNYLVTDLTGGVVTVAISL